MANAQHRKFKSALLTALLCLAVTVMAWTLDAFLTIVVQGGGSFSHEFLFPGQVEFLRRLLFLITAGAVILASKAYIDRARQAERLVKAKEEETETIFNAAPMAILYKDLQNRVIRGNLQAAQNLGVAPEELSGLNINDIALPELAEQFLRDDLEVARTGRPKLRIVEKFQRPGQPEVWGEVDKLPFRNRDGEVIGIIAFVNNITEARRNAIMLRHLSRRVVEGHEAEARRIARELHDSVVQILSSAKFRLEQIEEDAQQCSCENIRVQAIQGVDLLGQAIQEVRGISRKLRPTVLDDLGLGAAVRALCQEIQQRGQFEVEYQEDSPPPDIPDETRLALYRIIQESLTNIEKHADASRVRIRLHGSQNQLELSIEDDGRGFPETESTEDGDRFGGMGLHNIRERAAYVGGWAEFLSSPQKGVTVKVHIPMLKDAESKIEDRGA